MNKDAAERKGKRSEVNSVYHYLAMCALFHLMHTIYLFSQLIWCYLQRKNYFLAENQML